MQCLGLDFGSTSIKGAVLDLEHQRVCQVESHPFPQPIANLPQGHVEIDPSLIVQAAESVIDRLAAHVDTGSRLMVCGQMGGVILANENGNARSNYLSWRDVRTALPDANGQSLLEQIRQRWSNELLASLGNELQAGSTTSLLAWLVANDGMKCKDIPLSIADYAISHWCKQPGRLHVTHAIGMLNPSADDWHFEAFEMIGLGKMRWPELSHDTQSVGSWTRHGKAFEVHGSYGDQQCALFGAGLQRGQLSINISTGSQVSLLADSFQTGPYQSRKYFDGDWLNTVTHLPAGRSLNALVDLLQELSIAEGRPLAHPWQTIARKMERVSQTTLHANLAFFPGPLGNQGKLDGMMLENLSVGHLFLAACNAMVDNYATASDRLDPKRAWNSIVLSGGLSQALPRLVELIRQRFDASIRESVGEETLIGLLKLAQSLHHPSSLSELSK